VQSVHSFGENRELAWLFTGFMVLTLTLSFALVIYRMPMLRARNELDSWASREAAFLVNNWVLLFAAFFVLFATMFPTLSEAVTGERLTVAAPFFNKWLTPVGFVLLFLTGDHRRLAVGVRQPRPAVPGARDGGRPAPADVLGLPRSSGLCRYMIRDPDDPGVLAGRRGRRGTGTDPSPRCWLVLRERRRRRLVVHLGIVLP
jgi:hypothetical protein